MDLSELETLYSVGGPVVSLHINVSRDAEDADHAIGVRWENARQSALANGVEESTVVAMDDVVGNTRGVAGPHGQMVFAGRGRVIHEFPVASTPQEYQIRVGPLADPMLYLRDTGHHVPFVLGVVDSHGADLTAEYPSGRRIHREVAGEDKPTHKVRKGGYHHHQMQRAVEEQVKQNLKVVADEMTRLAKHTEAEVVAIAGEISVRGELVDLLPDSLRDTVIDLEAGSRSAGSEQSPLLGELDRRLAEQEEGHVAEIVAQFEQGRELKDRVTEGLARVVRALQRGQVDTLLWGTGFPGTSAVVWVGPSGQELASSEEEAVNLGIDQPLRESAEAGLLRAAVATSAELVLVSPERLALHDHIGAILRF